MESTKTGISLYIDAAPKTGSVLEDVLHGLSASPKSLPPRLFYDQEGSRLFDAICELEEYYPTRTEIGIMQARIEEIAEELGPQVLLVEYGSGSSLKTEILLQRLPAMAGYVPIDISRKHLLSSARRIARRHPDLAIFPVTADYTQRIPGLPDLLARHRPVVYFPGSTIGNFQPPRAEAFLRRAAELVGPGGGMLIGVDLRKDRARLEAAYDDASGVTAAFNLNMLRHVNREVGPVFDLEAFRHRAVWNAEASRIEMHLVSVRDQVIDLEGQEFRLAEGEAIVTEHSYKYTLDGFEEMAARAGFETRHTWTDPDSLFSVHYLVADQ
ncbi:MAG: L-histidine N(alpha)-methyltransferase [Rhodothermales bacterium]|nr:L-histidine N(alpha)-methyltransferase [Rhodothermales bacterium]